jgi:single-strand DNA-binding protein
MSRSTNIVAISGNLTRDPELRTTSSGTIVCSLSIAVAGREKVNGEWKDRADFLDVTVFGNDAERAGEWLHKGSHVEVSGRIRQDRWETNDGSKRSAVKIIANEIVYPPKASGGYQPGPSAAPVDAEDDIPF